MTKFTQLTAPGSTDSINVGHHRNHTFQYVVASVDTNVVVKVEGSLDGTNWFNLDSDTTTITADGTYAFKYSNIAISFARFTFVSETTLTNATIDVSYYGN